MSTEGARYASDFVDLALLIDKDLDNYNNIVHDDPKNLILVQTKTLAFIGKLIERAEQNSIKIGSYSESENEYVASHSNISEIFYKTLKINFEKVFDMESKLLSAQTEADAYAYISESALVFPQIDLTIKNSLELFKLLPVVFLSDDNTPEDAKKLADLLVIKINNLYGDKETSEIQAGDSAFVAGASFVKQSLEDNFNTEQ